MQTDDITSRGCRALFPVFLNIAHLPVLIIGGGPIGCRRARSLVDAGATQVTVVAPDLAEVLPEGVRHLQEPFRKGHLAGQRLVLTATDSTEVNEAVQRACHERGILCGRADAGEAGDFLVPLTWRSGGITAAVSAGSPALAQRLLEELSPLTDAWAPLAETAGRLRARLLKAEDAGAARAALKDLASREALDVMGRTGEAGVRAWLAGRHPSLGAVLEGS